MERPGESIVEYSYKDLDEACDEILEYLSELDSHEEQCVAHELMIEISHEEPNILNEECEVEKETKGSIEDVFVQVQNLVFPMDFVVLDMAEDSNQPLIFGRPLLAMGRALIDVQDGDLTFRVNDEELKISIYDAMKKADDKHDECYSIQDMPATLEDDQCLDTDQTMKGELKLRVYDGSYIISKFEPIKFHEDEGSTKLKELKSLKNACAKKTVGERSLKDDHLGPGETHDRGRPLIHLPP